MKILEIEEKFQNLLRSEIKKDLLFVVLQSIIPKPTKVKDPFLLKKKLVTVFEFQIIYS